MIPGATPIRIPLTARPKIVPAQWVPWLLVSLKSWGSPAVKFRPMISTPENAGWSLSIPVSSTATVTPLPLNGEVVAPTALIPQA